MEETPEADILDRLTDLIEQRKAASAETSYVASLIDGGVGRICEKICEEAGEVCEAAGEADREHLIRELCDLLFHMLVLAASRDAGLPEIRAELTRRFGVSGFVEKAGRGDS